MGWQDAPEIKADEGQEWTSAPEMDLSELHALEMALAAPVDRGAFGGHEAWRGARLAPTPWWQQRPLGLPSVENMTNALPVLGGAGGGIVGGIGGSVAGTPVAGGVPGAIQGSILGGAAGEGWKQSILSMLRGRPEVTDEEEAKRRMGLSALEQGAYEATGQGIAGGVKKVLNPFAGSVDRTVLEAAQRQGVEMPASALSESRAVPVAEAWAAKGWGGGKIGRRYSDATKELTAMAEHTVKRAGALQDASAQGQAIAKGLQSFRKEWIRSKATLYKQAQIGEGMQASVKDTIGLLDDIIAKKESAATVLKGGGASDVKFYKGLRDGLLGAVKTTPAKEQGKVIAELPIEALEKGWSLDSAYLAAGERGVGMRLADVEKALAEGKQLAVPSIVVQKTPRGPRIIVEDGRHRLAAMRSRLGEGGTVSVLVDESEVPLLNELASTGTTSAKDLLNAQREITAKLKAAYSDPFTAGNKGLLKKVAASMDSDLMNSIKRTDPELAMRLEKANAVYRDGLQKITGAAGTKIHKLAQAGQYDQIAKGIVKSSMSVDDIPRIMEVAGEQGTEALRTAVLADLITKASTTGPPTQAVLTPMGLSRAMKTFGYDRLQAILTPEQYSMMADLATLSASLQKGERVMSGSQTAFLARMGVGAGGAGGMVAGGISPWAFFGAVAGNTASNRFIASRVGQKWLTTGIPLSRMNQYILRESPRLPALALAMSEEKKEEPSLRQRAGMGW